jgi:hypothetical protein
VNLGIHPIALPDVIDRDVDPRKICEMDCEFRRRLSDGASDQWWTYTQLKSSKAIAAQQARLVLEQHGLPAFELMGCAVSPLNLIDPVSFDAGIFDFRGFMSTKVRMARALSLMRREAGDLTASAAFARIALANLGGASGLRWELEKLAG